jgi:hypothetical protein
MQEKEALLEELAAIEHERWAHWQQFMHEQGKRQPDGSLLLPAELIAKWDRLIETPYFSLTNNEQESDREQVRRYLPVVDRAYGKVKL